MTQEKIDKQILKYIDNVPYKSISTQALKLGMTIEVFIERRDHLRRLKQLGTDVQRDILLEEKDSITMEYIAQLEDRITEQKFDMEKGTGTLTGVFSVEPMSPGEVEVYFKIADMPGWKLSSYWNKAQHDGRFLVSANISQTKNTDVAVMQEDFLAAIREVFTDVKMKPYTVPYKKSNNKSLMVYTSDKHIGAYVPENGLYKNEYSADVFAKRMQLLLEEIFYQESIYGHFENIYILDLGDALDGWNAQTTRGGHRLPQNMNNRQCFDTYLRAHKYFFDTLLTSGIANKFHFKAVTNDNHSSDLAYMTTRALEEYLNLKFPQMTTKILNQFIEHFVMDKHTFIMCHGKDSEDMKHGLPLHLNDKTINFINNYIDYHKISTEDNTIHFIKGDLHQDTVESSTKFRYRNTSSMFGSSKWAMHNFLPQAPGVSFDVIENNTSRVYPYQMTFNATTTL